MKVDLPLYPTLTETLLDKLSLKISELEFYYTRKRSKRGIIKPVLNKIILEEKNSSPIELLDAKGYWNIEHDDLIIKQNIKVNNTNFLFGYGGIASKGSVLGVAVEWSSFSSLHRGTQILGEIKYGDDKFESDVELSFAKKQLRKNIKYKIILYIKEPDVTENTYYANTSGMQVGTLYEEEIILEGDVSSFPIISIEDEDAPLWSLSCNWGSIYDPFADSIRLKLNKSHKDYKYLNMETKDYNSYLFQQILVSVVVQIIHEAVQKNNISMVEETDDLPPGTIGALIKYYIQTYEINYSDLSSIYDSINKHIWG